MKAVLKLCFLFLFLFINTNVTLSSTENGNHFKNYYQLDLPAGVLGPESMAFDCNGKGPYVGVSDGRVLKWQGSSLGWSEFAIPSSQRDRHLCDGSTNTKLEPTCGRPLGLKFNPRTCDLFIADAYFGLLLVGPNGGVAKQLAASADGVPFKLTNALDVDDQTGFVYFTDSSVLFQRREYILSFISGDRSGRLLKYDPNTNKVSVLFRGLAFPNGVALSKDKSFLLVAEGATMKIFKFPLVIGSQQALTPQLIAQLGRTPDNIKRNKNGEFWVALNSGRGELRKLSPNGLALANYDNDDKALISYWFTKDPVGLKLDEHGKVTIKLLDGYGGEELDSISEVEEQNGSLYLGSSVKPYVGVINA